MVPWTPPARCGEAAAHSEQGRTLRQLLKQASGWGFTDDTGIGLKPISQAASKRLVRYELADHAVIVDDCDGDPGGRILVQDRIADAMFQDILLHPERHQVIGHHQPQRRAGPRPLRGRPWHRA